MSSGQYARRRVPIRGPITGLVLVAIVAFGAYWGWNSAFNDADTSAAAHPSGCPTSSTSTHPPTGSTTVGTPSHAQTGPVELQPSAVTVNVYNATERRGLAANTASGLRARGFVIGQTTNDPLGQTVAGVGEIRAGTATEPAVQLLIQHVPGATVVADGRTDGTVDFVIGDAFVALGNPATVTPVLLPSGTPC